MVTVISHILTDLDEYLFHDLGSSGDYGLGKLDCSDDWWEKKIKEGKPTVEEF
ncbi:hypothetical protein HanRHA438_Chr02g0092091 [Helianthus annuus]|nr:hypothetical protein HanRHA438_Chr02g0092091 [Helianthus annuus]